MKLDLLQLTSIYVAKIRAEFSGQNLVVNLVVEFSGQTELVLCEDKGS